MTTPVYLIRHAKAANRLKWEGPDHLRPLTKAGHRQARALVPLIGERLSQLVSSPYLRCTQTLEPLAAARGLELETTNVLAEGAWADDALALALSLARDGPAALCTHGDVMMLAVEQLVAGGVPLHGPLEFRKGATWILEVGEGAFVGARYLPPPAKSELG